MKKVIALLTISAIAAANALKASPMSTNKKRNVIMNSVQAEAHPTTSSPSTMGKLEEGHHRSARYPSGRCGGWYWDGWSYGSGAGAGGGGGSGGGGGGGGGARMAKIINGLMKSAQAEVEQWNISSSEMEQLEKGHNRSARCSSGWCFKRRYYDSNSNSEGGDGEDGSREGGDSGRSEREDEGDGGKGGHGGGEGGGGGGGGGGGQESKLRTTLMQSAQAGIHTNSSTMRQCLLGHCSAKTGYSYRRVGGAGGSIVDSSAYDSGSGQVAGGIGQGLWFIGNGIRAMRVKFGETKFEIGNQVITTPRQGFFFAFLGTLDLSQLLGKKALDKISRVKGAQFYAYTTVTFPVEGSTVVSFPTVTTIYSRSKKTIFTITHSQRPFEDISKAFAFSRVVLTLASMIKSSIKFLKLDCIQSEAEVPITIQNISYSLNVEKICGLSGLKFAQNVEILSDEADVLIVRLPCSLHKAKVTFNGVTATERKSKLNEDHVVVQIDQVYLDIDASFQPEQSSVKFKEMTIRLEGLKGFKIKSAGTKQSEKTAMIEIMDTVFRQGFEDFVKKYFEPPANKISQLISGQHMKFGFLRVILEPHRQRLSKS